LRNMTPRGPPRSLQYGQQHRGNLRRSTLRAHSPALLANTNSSKGFTAARTQACTRVCTCEQRPQRTHTQTCTFRAMVLTKVDNILCIIKIFIP
jgi:hypothetical protein